jgi:uncharacterized protein YqeY
MNLATRLHEDMKAALKSGQKDRLSVIRMLLSDVKVIDMAPKPTTAEQAVAAYAKKLRKAREEMAQYKRDAEVKQLDFELSVVEEYMPKKATQEQTEALVTAFLAANAFTEKQAGQAVGAFMKAHGEAVDPGIANPILRAKLVGR